MPKTGLTGAEVWGRVLRDGFGAPDPKGLSEGDRYTFPAGEGQSFSGRVLDCQPPRQLAETVDELEDGIFRVEVFAARTHLWLGTWRGDPAAVDRFKEPWRQMLEGLFRQPVPSAKGSAD